MSMIGDGEWNKNESDSIFFIKWIFYRTSVI